MRRPLVAGNWKMNGSREQASALARAVAGIDAPGAEIAVCPAYPYLGLVGEALADSAVRLGAQDVAAQAPGAFTGAVSAQMLLDVGCTMAIVGHSERRTVFGEDDAEVAAKFQAAGAAGLTPILCLGESLAERESGETLAVVGRQLQAVIDLAGPAAVAQSVLAYEPVWAIGTGRTASPQQAQEVHAALRAHLARADAAAERVRILYGGSVKPDNAPELFAMADIDGGLIGGAALVAADFEAVCKAAGS